MVVEEGLRGQSLARKAEGGRELRVERWWVGGGGIVVAGGDASGVEGSLMMGVVRVCGLGIGLK